MFVGSLLSEIILSSFPINLQIADLCAEKQESVMFKISNYSIVLSVLVAVLFLGDAAAIWNSR